MGGITPKRPKREEKLMTNCSNCDFPIPERKGVDPYFCSIECSNQFREKMGKIPNGFTTEITRQKPTERKEGEQPKYKLTEWEEGRDRERKISAQLNPDYYDHAMMLILELQREREASKKEFKKLIYHIDILFVMIVLLWICVLIK